MNPRTFDVAIVGGGIVGMATALSLVRGYGVSLVVLEAEGHLAGKDVWNKAQAAKASDLTLDPSAARPGDVVELTCGVHAWMHGYIAVQDSPYFAVTAL